MANLTNFIKIDTETNTLTGNIASLTYDVDLKGVFYETDNPKAPVYRLQSYSPAGNEIEIGGIWKKTNQKGNTYYSASINTGHGRVNANLGRYPGQDDDTLYAIIPWDQ